MVGLLLLFLHRILARLVAFRHVLEDAEHLLAEAVGTENDDFPAMPQQFLLEIARRTYSEFVVGVGIILRIAYLCLTLVQRYLVDIVVLWEESADAYLYRREVRLLNDAVATSLGVVGF